MTRRWSFNPFSGVLEPTESPAAVEFAEKIADIFTCDPSVAVGDLVRPSETVEDEVVAVSSNVYPNIVFGVVINKPTSTSCEVLISGKLDGYSGLAFGKVIWAGTSGEVTTTKPTTGHQQKLGIAIKSDTIFLFPSTEKVILA